DAEGLDEGIGVRLADLVDDELVDLVHRPAQRLAGGLEGLGGQLDAFDQQQAGVGDHAVQVAHAQLVPLVGRAGHAALVARRVGHQLGAGQHHGGGAGTGGQRGELVAQLLGGDVRGHHALQGLFIDQVGAFAVDDQRVVDVAAFDHARGHVHAVDEGQAGIGDVEGDAVVADAQVAGNDGGGGRLQVVAADRGVDQQADAVGGYAGVFQRLAPGHGGRVRGLGALVPQAARV